jgi:polyphosphate glucokinase
MATLGIDIGGTGIKGAPVDLVRGELLAERKRLLTPSPSTPEAVAASIAEIVSMFPDTTEIGCGYPGVVKYGRTMTAANVDQGWIGCPAADVIAAATGRPVTVVNDADAAGIAEMTYGAGRGQQGVVILTTLGTGIGTAIFYRGQLLPNTELGHIEIRGKDAETRASERQRIKKRLSWREWAARLDEYYTRMENLFWPDLFIVGGGASKEHERFLPLLTLRTPIVPAALRNEAGIIGAAMARESLK